MSMLREFREFAMRGNVVDLAVGIVIGGAFGKITSSLVNDVIMPPLGYLLGKVDFKDLKLNLVPPGDSANAVTINYGQFINTVVDFVIVAFAMFLVVKAMNRLKRKQEAPPPAPPAPPPEVALLTEIRDLLKSK